MCVLVCALLSGMDGSYVGAIQVRPKLAMLPHRDCMLP